jgi:cytochrome c biogenesis protein CcdA
MDEKIAYALGGFVLLIMALQFFGAYHLPVKKVFRSLRLPPSTTPIGTFLLGLSFGAITMGRVAPMLFAVLAMAAVSGSVIYGLTISLLFGTGMVLPLVIIGCDIFLFPCFESGALSGFVIMFQSYDDISLFVSFVHISVSLDNLI